ncbi:cell envelope integrity protein TolA [Psychrobacter sp. DAB_AL62B]|uniref:cell envelope integrity protein TolA n=1 Tax=Psychrobacter sp. DAB_AL62B TaxID=1028420 RepID=UPI00238168D6|nr:cell envelope integrity protein TolA [Psychrobacter sp. DAB_AL62B]MDE4453780.1 energy transducer TonB [Psychrobacter sp. DAB_AL62B]
MHNAPVVYVPTEPEGNGLTLPTLLSLLAHSLVIGILIYTYQNMEVETAGSIETVMVSPEQLAEMQGQILANRAAAASAMQSESSASGASSAMQTESFDGSVSTPNPTQQSSQRVPVFTRSDDPASRPMLMSEEQHQRLLEQNQEYERGMAEWAAQLDESVLEEHDQVEKEKRQQLIEEQKKLGDFRNKQNNPPKIKRPTANDRNIEINTGGSGSAGQKFSLSDDGQSTLSGDTTTSSTSKGSSRSASSGARGASNSEIINLIKRNYNPPIAAKGSTQRATLTITVNASGNIVNVTASGPDSAVNEAAKQAVLDTGSLPIDADDPKYPTFTIQFKGSN